jgi:hypothetical protein
LLQVNEKMDGFMVFCFLRIVQISGIWKIQAKHLPSGAKAPEKKQDKKCRWRLSSLNAR